MNEVIVLGSANAIPGKDHDNTHLLALSQQRAVLIDCGNNPIPNLKEAGIAPDRLTDLVLTHFHPDHVSSAPLLLMGLWLLGRTRSLNIYGLADTIDRMETMMDLYDWRAWPDFYTLIYHRVPAAEMSLAIDGEDLRIYSSPVRHLIPTIGLRIEFLTSGRNVAYSSDTEPAASMVRLARDVDLLIHEATGESLGHSSAAQAAQIANEAGAKSLCLIHYNGEGARGVLVQEARAFFAGPIIMAKDFLTL